MFGHCFPVPQPPYTRLPVRECKGLYSLDPYFNLPRSLTPSLRPGLVLWAGGAERERFCELVMTASGSFGNFTRRHCG